MSDIQIQYHHLVDLEIIPKTNWTIMVRVARKWSETNNNGVVEGVHLVLIDEGHKRMHAWISLTATPELGDLLQAGKNYCVRNFNVEPFTGKYRCFEADKHIVLTTSTRIEPLPDRWGLIPDQIFYFTNLRHIENHPPEDTYLIDVVGNVIDMKGIVAVTNPRKEQQFYIDFVITDFIHEVKVRFWDDLAMSFQQCFHDATEHPAIVIISSCKLLRNNYTGKTSLANVQATTFAINSNCCRVDNLRKRFWELNGFKVTVI